MTTIINYTFDLIYFNFHKFFKFKSKECSEVGVSLVVGHDRVSMSIYCLATFFYFLKKSLPVYIVDDGSLTDKDKRRLSRIFTVTFQSPDSGLSIFKKKLEINNHFLKYRKDEKTPVVKLKFDAYLLNPFKRCIYLDTDLLFFSFPNEIAQWINKKQKCYLCLDHNRSYLQSYKREDVDHSFRLLLEKSGYPILSPSFNSGLLCLPSKKIFNIDMMNEIFTLFYKLGYTTSFTSEETALSILYLTQKSYALPNKKYICPARKDELFIAKEKPRILIHYIFETKEEIKKETILLMFKNHFFLNRSHA